MSDAAPQVESIPDVRGLDIAVMLGHLAEVRPLFSSERDFQLALAWQLQLSAPALTLRLERRPDPTVRQAADLWITDPHGQSLVLELKYFVRAVDITLEGERFVLAHQGAHDTSRYDTIKDLTRVEGWVRAGLADRGAVIALTNDPAYWRAPTRQTIDAQLRLHEGRQLHGDHAWDPVASEGTTLGRTTVLQVDGHYTVAWRPYSNLHNGMELRTLILDTATKDGAQPGDHPQHPEAVANAATAPAEVSQSPAPLAPAAGRDGVRHEILAAARDLTSRGLAPLSPQDVVDELRRQGSTYPENTVRTHVVSAMCIEAPANHAVRYPDLHRVSRGRYVLADGHEREPQR